MERDTEKRAADLNGLEDERALLIKVTGMTHVSGGHGVAAIRLVSLGENRKSVHTLNRQSPAPRCSGQRHANCRGRANCGERHHHALVGGDGSGYRGR